MKENDYPLVSVFVLTYKSAKTVLETLESIFNLTYPRIELIISDDCSPDNTVALCREWLEQHERRFEKARIITVDKNTGVSKNQRRAVEACTADWIKGIAGDDALFPDSITDLMRFVKSHPDALMINGQSFRYENFLDDEHLIEVYGSPDLIFNKVNTARQQFNLLLNWPCIDAPAVFYHRRVFGMPELKDAGYAGLEDYPLFLRFTGLGHKIYYCDAPICKYRQSPTSIQNTSNYGNIITKSYLAHFFDETHRYYRGIDGIARYGIAIHNKVMLNGEKSILPRLFHYLYYPVYWACTRTANHYNKKRIRAAKNSVGY